MMNEWIISSSILIAAVLLGRLVLRGRISLRLQYALWAVALIRLLLPIQIFTSDFSTGSIARDVDISAPVRQVYVSVNEERYEREYDEAYRQVVAEYEAANRHETAVEPIVMEQAAQERARSNLELDLNQLLHHIWLAGMVAVAAVIIFCNVHLSIQLRRRRWELDVPDSRLPVYITEAVPTPCIFGFFRPAIYLTPDAAKDEQVRAHVLEHELTHYRHWDHVWSVLRSLCLVLHWYNPLVWSAAKVSRADAELACDEGTLARLGEEQRGDYGRTLIGLTCSAPISDLLLTATTMTGSAGSLRERIRLLMKRPRNTVLTLTAVVLMVTLIVGCTFAGAPETTQPPETTDPGVDNDMSYHGQDLPIHDDLTQTDLAYALPMEQAMKEYADKNPRKLTTEELETFRAAFSILAEDGNVNPAACFLHPYYDEIREMDGNAFLAYFPCNGDATEEEFALLKAKYPEVYQNWTWDDLPVLIHRYEARDIDAVVSRYGNIRWAELDEGVHYLEETGCYYNCTSDFGLGNFTARSGFVYDGGAVVYSDSSALFLTETLGNFTIQAHLPVIKYVEDGIFTSEGLLVYPGTEWGMTEYQVRKVLHFPEYSTLSGMRGILVPDTEFCGYPASIEFYFDRYRDTDEWGLCDVEVQLANEEDANAVYNILCEQLGRFDFQTSGVAYTAWWSDVKLADMISPEAYAIYQENTEEYPADGGAASTIAWFGDSIPEQENVICFSSDLSMTRQIEAAIAPDQPTQVRALFAEGGDPWYLAALAAPYADYLSFDPVAFFSAGQTAVALTDAEKTLITETYGKEALEHTIFRMTEQRMDQVLDRYAGTMIWNVDLSEFVYCNETDSYLLVREEVPELRIPEIISCVQLAENQVRMTYRFPGEEQRYCATLLKGETWKVYSNHLLLNKPENARALTEEEVASVRLAFAPDYYDAAANESICNPRAAFLLDMYSDISEMSRSKFLTYYPATEKCEDEAEFQLLKKKYPQDFETEQTIRDMNWPIHRIPASELKAVMEEYTLAKWDDLPYDGWYHYLEETDCYYTYYSDVGLFGFHCIGGWVYDGGAILYNDFASPVSVLILTEKNGEYYIQAHLPALITE